MIVRSIKLNNVSCFRKLEETELSESINIFIGENNSGKSTILNSVLALQNYSGIPTNKITVGESEADIDMRVGFSIHPFPRQTTSVIVNFKKNGSYERICFDKEDAEIGKVSEVSNSEPFNIVYPFLAKRKNVKYSGVSSQKNQNLVGENLEFLSSKIQKLLSRHPQDPFYVNACNEILGFVITSEMIGDQLIALKRLEANKHIQIDAMGEGIAHILGLITLLSTSVNKIFVIEELENDLHPRALKALLRLIINCSENNQFFISTHSHIVLKYLSTESSKTFQVQNFQDNSISNHLAASLNLIDSKEKKRQALEDLGYELNDFDLYNSYLILEESSAEYFVREHIIPWFVSGLNGKLKSISAKGVGNVSATFEEFNRLFVCLHLQPLYKNKVFVIIDKGEEEDKIIEKLKKNYSNSWQSSTFSQLTKSDFEKYYPARFKEKVNEVLGIDNKDKKRAQKKKLFMEVKRWTEKYNEIAKSEFKESASEIIDKLIWIKSELDSNR